MKKMPKIVFKIPNTTDNFNNKTISRHMNLFVSFAKLFNSFAT